MPKLSIIIPTLNESLYITETLDSLISNKYYQEMPELVVVDSGSIDNTISIASNYTTKIIKLSPSKSGKYELLNKGAQYSTGDILSFLDADTLLPKNYDLLIERCCNGMNVVGGAFEFSLNGDELGLRIVEIINRVRYRIRSSFYGDQGLFVKRGIFFKAGMFPKRRLFETAELCKILRKFGRLILLKENAITSPRRFLEGGIYNVLLDDIKLWFLNEVGIYLEDKLADGYWEYNKFARTEKKHRN